jgi:dTDP-4-dehydrorhamnose 3,5-epimerase
MKGVIVKKIEPVFSDERGAITDLLNENINHVGLITTTKGSARGNHYHKKSIQYSYILSGKFEVLLANVNDLKKVELITLNSDEIIIIQPGIVHTFKAIEDSVMIDMISESRSGEGYEEDTVKGIKLQ